MTQGFERGNEVFKWDLSMSSEITEKNVEGDIT